MAAPRSPEPRVESLRLGIGVALAGTLVGPAGAWLYETGQLDLFSCDAAPRRLARRSVRGRRPSAREEPRSVVAALVGRSVRDPEHGRNRTVWVPCELLLLRRFPLKDVS